MSENTTNSDAELDRLIRQADVEPADFQRPDDDAIRAYMLGEATTEQKHAVRAALERSAAFRREVLEIAEDLEGLGAEGAASAIEDLDSGIAETKSSLRRADGQPTLRERLSRWLSTPRWIGAAVGAALIVLLAFLYRATEWTGRTTPELVDSGLEREALISNVVRAPGGGQPAKVFQTAGEAALAEFRSLLRWEAGEFVFRSVAETSDLPEGSGKRHALRLVDDKGAEVGDWARTVPDSEVRIWILSLPALDLRSLVSVEPRTTISWDSAWGTRGCVTWTYKIGTGYSAVAGVTFGARR